MKIRRFRGNLVAASCRNAQRSAIIFVMDATERLAAIPQVRHAERLFGDPDYLLRVSTADIAAYQSLRDEKLATLPGVQRLTSTIVMKRIVDDRPYPV